MKIWYQSFSGMGFDPSWENYERLLKTHLRKISRLDTTVHVQGVAKFSPKMVHYKYFQYLHLGQVIENALRAEREGFDAFVLGGMLDHGYYEIREVVGIPVLFIGETSFHVACLLSRKFGVVAASEVVLRGIEDNIRLYGLGDCAVPGAHIGVTSEKALVASFVEDPQPVIDKVAGAVRQVAARGAGIIVPGFGALSLFLAEKGVTQVDGIPILDNTAALIKSAEMMVDMGKIGVAGVGGGRSGTPTREEITATRRLYGVER